MPDVRILLAEADRCTVEHNTCVLNPIGISIREQANPAGPRINSPGLVRRRSVAYGVLHFQGPSR
jgi:parallel beta-helix repeat protein